MTSRDSYSTVGEATRDLLEAAAQAEPRLRPLEWRTLSAVIAYTTTWSRLRDEVYLDQLAGFAGFEKSRNVGRELASLRDRGLIGYAPGRGKRPGGAGSPGTVSIAAADRGKGGEAAPPTPLGKGAEAAPVTDAVRGAARDARGVRNGTDKGGGTTTPPEKYPEKFSENDDEVTKFVDSVSDLVSVDRKHRASVAAVLSRGDGWTAKLLADHVRRAFADAEVRSGGGFLASLLRDLGAPPAPKRRRPGHEPCQWCSQPVEAHERETVALMCQTVRDELEADGWITVDVGDAPTESRFTPPPEHLSQRYGASRKAAS